MSARTVSEALAILNAARAVPGRVARYALVCGSTPLHLGTFVAAELQRRLPGIESSSRPPRPAIC